MDLLQRFAEPLVQQGLLAEDAVPWLRYAFQRRLLSFTGSLLLFGLGWFFAGHWEAFSFLFSFFLLRRRAGGYHAGTPWRCLLLSVAQVWLSLAVLLPLLTAAPLLCSGMALLAGDAAIAATAPLLPRQLHATAAETAACRKLTRRVLALENSAALVLALWGKTPQFLSVVLGITAAAGSLLLEQYKRRHSNEENVTTSPAAAGGQTGK